MPRLLKLIEDLTNWYIRFNRKRCKGENGVDDCLHSLSTLFEVLFTLARTMAPFTPFLVENMYQGLQQFIRVKALSDVPSPDVRSIHFLAFPDVVSSYFNPVIEKTMSRMQAVINLARTIRELNMISLKVATFILFETVT